MTLPIEFVVHGVDEGKARGPGPAPAIRAGFKLKASVRVAAARGDGDRHRITTASGDVLVLHLENGPELMLNPETARELLLSNPQQRKDADGRTQATAIEVPRMLRWEGAPTPTGSSRGLLSDVVIRLVEVFAVELAVDALKGSLDPEVDRLYRLQEAKLAAPAADPAPADRVTAEGASLVFIHGTFSSTVGGYAKLWTHHPDRVKSLFTKYNTRIFGFEHATLGRSPIENALALVRGCDHGAVLHLVTHSRGGLVAEALARASGQQALTGLADKLHPRDCAALADLVRELADRKIQVERVVRVACPARGTLLAGNRLDVWLSVFRWGLTGAGVPVAPALVSFLGAVAKERKDPTELPGLEAMTPESPLVEWLHAAPEPVAGELWIVAGDLEGDSVGSWVKTLMSDAFFWTDHDLVVQTRSMYGGVPRKSKATFLLDRGGKVDHFHYFENERTAGAIVGCLVRTSPPGWDVVGPLSYAGESATGTRAARPPSEHPETRPALILLPGILGSHLAVDGDRIWLGFRFVGGLERLAITTERFRVKPDGVIGSYYDELTEYLSESHEVSTYPFDWRVPIEDAADVLANVIQRELDRRVTSGQPVRFLAHSMGGLVVRTMALRHPKVWRAAMARSGARFVMLGTPNGGSYVPMQVLSGDDTFGNLLGAFGAPFQAAKARQLMAAFPGFLQLQADLGGALGKSSFWASMAASDLKASQDLSPWHRWTESEWGVPTQKVLDQALALRRQLDDQASELHRSGSVVLVVGSRERTPDGFEERPNEPLWYLDTDQGDGRVSHARARLPSVPTWRVGCAHSELPSFVASFGAYLDLLRRGDTSALPRLEDDAPARSPTRSRPAREASGGLPPNPGVEGSSDRRPTTSGGAPDPRLEIRVEHGSLAFTPEPVLLGHYDSIRLTGTEAFLDPLLGGAMGDSLRAGIYPSAVGENRVFMNRPSTGVELPKPKAALIVGLGPEGELTIPELSRTVRQGVLALAQRFAEHGDPGAADSLALAAVLVGSGGSGITAGQAAQAVARGVWEANAALAALSRLDDDERQDDLDAGRRSPSRASECVWPQVRRLDFVEVYLDRATDAWAALRELEVAAPSRYRVAPTIRPGVEGLRRSHSGGYRGIDSDLVRVIAHDGEPGGGGRQFEYSLNSRRARTEVRAVSTQAGLVRRLVETAAGNGGGTDFARALFRLLVPVEMEAFLGGTSELVIELDQETAAIPWEILDTRTGSSSLPDENPWSIRTRLMRRLRVEERYRQTVVHARREDAVLIIGEPEVDDARYPKLPGARAEAHAVAKALDGSGKLVERPVLLASEGEEPGPSACEIIQELLRRPWRVVHIAGHGEMPHGVVLSDGLFLGPAEIKQMREVPELVFVNCCHLGAMGRLNAAGQPDKVNLPGFASGVASSLMDIGVRCVIVAGWAVDDTAAREFACRFYQLILDGRRFAEAVAEARDVARSFGGNTWAAYQCYGDGDWTLRPDRDGSSLPFDAEYAGIASDDALTLALDELGVRPGRRSCDALKFLAARWEDGWGKKGRVAEAFGNAWAAQRGLDAREHARDWYQAACGAADGLASLRAAEQAGNLGARVAWERLAEALNTLLTPESAAALTQEARTTIKDATAALTTLAKLHPTLERWSLVGSAWKRKVQLERSADDPSAALNALEAMEKAYGKAAAMEGPDLFYPLGNLVASKVALGQKVPPLDLERLQAAAETRLAQSPDFWAAVAVVEHQLYSLGSPRKLTHAQAKPLLAQFQELHARYPRQRHWKSVSDNLDFVMHGATGPGVDALREGLSALGGGGAAP